MKPMKIILFFLAFLALVAVVVVIIFTFSSKDKAVAIPSSDISPKATTSEVSSTAPTGNTESEVLAEEKLKLEAIYEEMKNLQERIKTGLTSDVEKLDETVVEVYSDYQKLLELNPDKAEEINKKLAELAADLSSGENALSSEALETYQKYTEKNSEQIKKIEDAVNEAIKNAGD